MTGTAIAAGLVFVGLLVVVSAGGLGRGSVDMHIVKAANASMLAHPTLLALARAVTNVGASIVVYVVVAVTALLLWLTGRRAAAGYVVLVRLTAQAADSLVKVLVGRARPVLTHPVAHAGGYSFPSGHAAGAASVYLPLAVLACLMFTRRAFRVVAVLVAVFVCLAVAATRVLLGVHYPSDVLGGLALGVGLTAALTPLLSLSAPNRARTAHRARLDAASQGLPRRRHR